MTKIPETMLDQALQLPPDVREQLAIRLLDSLEPVDDDHEAAWAAEIQRRVDDLQSGREKAIPWEDVRRMILDGSAATLDDEHEAS